jgi:hypothetical protein
MNLSSSSNLDPSGGRRSGIRRRLDHELLYADVPSGPSFRVTTRALSENLSMVSITETARELGVLNLQQFGELLHRLSLIDSLQFHDADPQLLVSSRRGRFIVKPGRGHLLLRSAGEPDSAYFELAVDRVARYLDGVDGGPVTVFQAAVGATAAVVPADEPSARASFDRGPTIFALIAFFAGIGATVSFFTFKDRQVDSLVVLEKIVDGAERTKIGSEVIGTFVVGEGAAERSLEIRADQSVIYRESAPGLLIPEERRGVFSAMHRRSDQAIMLRVATLGSIEVRTDGALVFAGETYQRAKPGPKKNEP